MTAPGVRPLRIVTVCSHNRTRSVMMEAMLRAMLDDRLGEGAVEIRSSGFGPVDLPPIDDAVDAMQRRGFDVSSHRSSTTTAALVDAADLVLTAERNHVVKIAALSRDAFRRAMTLPEFLAAAAEALHDHIEPATELAGEDGGEEGGDLIRRWTQQLTTSRTAGEYLRGSIPEVADPTGSAPRAFEAAVVAIEQQCREAAALISSRFR